MNEVKRKISILGAGNVGATIAYTLSLTDLASEILLVDINKEKAEGEMLDISQCAASSKSVTVRSGEYEDVAGSDIVIVTFGVGRKPGQTRLDLAKINVGILESVMPNVAKICPEALYVIVSNPVDVLTYATIKCTGLPKERVIGTGTLLDTNRLVQMIASYANTDVKNVTGYVLGEHGDACIPAYSLATICGYPIKKYMTEILGEKEEDCDAKLNELYTQMVEIAAKVIKAKGATFYAIASSVVKLVRKLCKDTHTILPLSTLLDGEYGAKDLCMGVPCVIGANGIEKVLEFKLSPEETAMFNEKIASLDKTYDALGVRK